MTHYETLGVSKDATLDQIKKAYRALAMKYHPDRNYGDKNAADKFREITESYEVLTDVQKKAVYDDTAFFKKHPHEDFTDPNAFSASRRYKATSEELDKVDCHFFGGGGFVGRNVLTNLYLTSKDLREGGMFTVKWKKRVKCKSCDGYGTPLSFKDNEVIKCKACAGTGHFGKVRLVGEPYVKCDYCDGSGVLETRCVTCGGSGLTKDMLIEEMMISIPAGIPSGHQIVVKGRGEQGEKSGLSGNLHVVVLG